MNMRFGFVRSRSWAAALFLLALAFSTPPAPGADARPAARTDNQTTVDLGGETSPAPPPRLPPALLAESWWERIIHPVESGLTNRTRMIQFGAVMMLLALWVIWWRRT
jgi:hypothetical protein